MQIYSIDLSHINRIQETFLEEGKRICNGERDRRNFSALNQLLCGHSKLNGHMSKINTNVLKSYVLHAMFQKL